MVDITNFVVLGSLGAGYLFQERLHYTRFKASAIEWEHRLLEAAVFGGGLFLLGRVCAVTITGASSADVAGSVLYLGLKSLLPFGFSGSVILAVLFAVIIPPFVNLVLTRDRAARLVNRRYGDALRNLLASSGRGMVTVCLRMKSNIVWVGAVTLAPGFRKDDRFFRLLPLMKGYAESDTSDVNWHTSYALPFTQEDGSAYEYSSRPALETVLLLDDIEAASEFEENALRAELRLLRERADATSAEAEYGT